MMGIGGSRDTGVFLWYTVATKTATSAITNNPTIITMRYTRLLSNFESESKQNQE